MIPYSVYFFLFFSNIPLIRYSRYQEQANNELDPMIFQIFDLKDIFKCGQDIKIGYDPELFTYPAISRLILLDTVDKPRYDNLQKINGNLVDKIWYDQPLEPNSKVYLQSLEFAGVSHIEKISKCRAICMDSRFRGNDNKRDRNDTPEFIVKSVGFNYKKRGATPIIIGETTSDDVSEFKSFDYALIILDSSSICWLLNLRASDVAYTPLMFAKVIVTPTKLYLFIDPTRISAEIIKERPEITILPEEEFEHILKDQDNILIDDGIASVHIMDLIANKKIHKIADPCLLLKACKNEVEIKHSIDFHVKDAVALCEFFADFSLCHPRENGDPEKYNMDSCLRGNDIGENVPTEHTLGLKLTEYRTKQDGYVSDSFPAICGFRENSAIIHYRANPEKAKKIEGQGILLIDSGGQYQGATTDITRTIVLGGR